MFEQIKSLSELSNCVKNYKIFRRLFAFSFYEGTHLPRLLVQRWTGHINILEKFDENYVLIVQTLFQKAGVSHTDSTIADGLLNKVSTLEFVFVVLAMENFLHLIKPLNQYFKMENSEIVTASELIDSTICSLLLFKKSIRFCCSNETVK